MSYGVGKFYNSGPYSCMGKHLKTITYS